MCFYHLVYAGRGSKMVTSSRMTVRNRATVDLIMNRTRTRARSPEVLTADNHDGPYLYLRLFAKIRRRAEAVLTLLADERRQQHGLGIGCEVGTDRFTPTSSGGTTRRATSAKPFSEIKPTDELFS